MDYFTLTRRGIRWTVRPGQEHKDDIEMTGLYVSALIGYGVNGDGTLHLTRYCVFPTLRTIPNNTHASLRSPFRPESFPALSADGQEQTERAVSFEIDGVLTVRSKTPCFDVKREIFPTTAHRAAGEVVTVRNRTKRPVRLTLSTPETVLDKEARGTKGVYLLEVRHDPVDAVLQPGERLTFDLFCTARIANEPMLFLSAEEELRLRRRRVRQLTGAVTLTSDNPALDTMFRFACLRAGESVIRTLTGDLHAPGGTNFYAATWCNDQIEYSGPWFAQTGDKIDEGAAMNAYREYMPFMSDSYTPIPSSVISEGLDIWEGKGDRGDAAMYLYGASLFALLCGDQKITDALWRPIRWCAEYCRRKTGKEGVVCSDTDELEGRIPTDGYANLSTSCLCYGGLLLAAKIADEKHDGKLAAEYRTRAAALEQAIEDYFGETLHGFATYRYTKGGHDTLRSWICLPLCMEIGRRVPGTVDALFSDYLWTKNGMLTCERSSENKNDTAWDRSTLFAFKGACIADRVDDVWDKLDAYVHARLLGDRVPYAVEAYPENNMRHLSGESALFCRIITEGLLKVTPEGNLRYTLTLRLPKGMDRLRLSGLRLGGKRITVDLRRGNPCRILRGNRQIAQCPLGKAITVELH